MILAGILPLLVFVIVDSLAGLKAATITAIIMALLEAGLSLYWFGEIDLVTGASVLLVLGLAYITYHKQTAIFIKFQPVILSFLMGAMLLVSYWMGKPLLLEMSLKYSSFFPPEAQARLSHPLFQRLMVETTWWGGWAMIAHAAVTAWAALKLSNWWWLAIRGIGFYVFTLLAVFIARSSL